MLLGRGHRRPGDGAWPGEDPPPALRPCGELRVPAAWGRRGVAAFHQSRSVGVGVGTSVSGPAASGGFAEGLAAEVSRRSPLCPSEWRNRAPGGWWAQSLGWVGGRPEGVPGRPLGWHGHLELQASVWAELRSAGPGRPGRGLRIPIIPGFVPVRRRGVSPLSCVT